MGCGHQPHLLTAVATIFTAWRLEVAERRSSRLGDMQMAVAVLADSVWRVGGSGVRWAENRVDP